MAAATPSAGGTPAVLPSPGALPASVPFHETAVLVLVTLGSLMVSVDSTIVILALPTMGKELASPLDTVIWTILIYLLVTAVLTTQAGRLGDMWGLSVVYNGGFALFTLGSALSGFAPTATFLIGARAVQAVGGAVLFANGAALIAHVFPPNRRGRPFGFLVFGWSVGSILGVLLGGVITTTLGWRYNFLINIPIGLAAVALGVRTLPKTRREKTQLDYPGFVVFSALLSLICYGLIELAAAGVTGRNVAFLVVGFLLIPLFVFLELRSDKPMLQLRELRKRLLGLSLIAGFLQALGYLSVVFMLTMYLQGLRGLSPLDASVLLVPGYLVGAVAGPFMGRQVDRIGPRSLATGGILLMMVAVFAYAQLSLTTWLGWIPLISIVAGVGGGMFWPANNTAIMSQASPKTFGSVSGLRSTLSNMGTLLSFVLTLSIAAASVPRYVAYQVFLGTTNLVGGIGQSFLTGIDSALYGSAAILGVAAVLSWARGGRRTASGVDTRQESPPARSSDPDA